MLLEHSMISCRTSATAAMYECTPRHRLMSACSRCMNMPVVTCPTQHGHRSRGLPLSIDELSTERLCLDNLSWGQVLVEVGAERCSILMSS